MPSDSRVATLVLARLSRYSMQSSSALRSATDVCSISAMTLLSKSARRSVNASLFLRSLTQLAGK